MVLGVERKREFVDRGVFIYFIFFRINLEKKREAVVLDLEESRCD